MGRYIRRWQGAQGEAPRPGRSLLGEVGKPHNPAIRWPTLVHVSHNSSRLHTASTYTLPQITSATQVIPPPGRSTPGQSAAHRSRFSHAHSRGAASASSSRASSDPSSGCTLYLQAISGGADTMIDSTRPPSRPNLTPRSYSRLNSR